MTGGWVSSNDGAGHFYQDDTVPAEVGGMPRRRSSVELRDVINRLRMGQGIRRIHAETWPRLWVTATSSSAAWACPRRMCASTPEFVPLSSIQNFTLSMHYCSNILTKY
jgi:hypothetical protein